MNIIHFLFLFVGIYLLIKLLIKQQTDRITEPKQDDRFNEEYISLDSKEQEGTAEEKKLLRKIHQDLVIMGKITGYTRRQLLDYVEVKETNKREKEKENSSEFIINI